MPPAAKKQKLNHSEDFEKQASNSKGIEINFKGENPSPFDYFKMAMEEKEKMKKQSYVDDNDEIDKHALVQELFEKAISAYEKEWKTLKDVKKQKETIIQYADCLKELSIWSSYNGHIEDAEKLCEDWLKDNENEGRVWITLANIRLVKMTLSCEEENDVEAQEYYDEEEEEEEEGKPFVDNEMTAQEKQTFENIKSSIVKGFELLEKQKDIDKKTIAYEYSIISNSFYKFGLCQRQSLPKRQCVKCIMECFSLTIEYSKKAVETDDSLKDDNWIMAMPGFASYYLACIYNEKYNDVDKAMDYVIESVEIVMEAEKVSKANNNPIERAKFLDMIGQSYLLLSNLTTEEEDVVGAYENAIDALTASIKINPDNPQLINLLITLGVLNEDGTQMDGNGCCGGCPSQGQCGDCCQNGHCGGHGCC